MAFDDLRDNEMFLQLRDVGKGLEEAAKIVSAFHTTPEDVQDAITYLLAENLELTAHVHMSEELVAKIRDQFPQANPECYDVPLGDGFKYVIIHALGMLRNRIFDEMQQGGN